jgi:hypothetical protein
MHHLSLQYENASQCVSVDLDDGTHQPHYVCCRLLLLLLQQQLVDASVNLLKASATRPIYPTMLCIRYIMADISLV